MQNSSTPSPNKELGLLKFNVDSPWREAYIEILTNPPEAEYKYEVRLWPYEWGEPGREMGFANYYGHTSSMFSIINDVKELVEDIHAVPPITMAKRCLEMYSKIKRVAL